MNSEIEQQLDRIVNGEAIKVSNDDTTIEANGRIKLETAQGTYELPAKRFLIFLQKLPDDIGVEAL